MHTVGGALHAQSNNHIMQGILPMTIQDLMKMDVGLSQLLISIKFDHWIDKFSNCRYISGGEIWYRDIL